MRPRKSPSRLRGVIGLLGVALLVAGCATESPRAPQPATATPQTAAPPTLDQDKYLQALYADPRLDPIRDKVPLLLRAGAITPNYLSNEAKPTPPERDAIKVWLQVRELAQVHQTALRGEPSPLLVQTRQRVTEAIGELYSGKLTYAAFASRIQQIDEQHQGATRQNVGLHN
jgi:hypothetical protein